MATVDICNTVFATNDGANDGANDKYAEHFKIYEPLQLSDFQKWAVKAIVDADNVLITAHTGSGKTLPAEFAINYFHKQNKKVIYASPIKALSNQKLYDMRRKYPHISFGLLTGDCKDNPEADVLIMTTEILRNTLFNQRINATSSAPALALSFNLNFDTELAAVVFDEVHYINDAERGSVWEQAILLLPPQVQLIMLSATIDRPEDFAAWIAKEKQAQATLMQQPVKKMYLTSTADRVVPLTHYMWLAVHNGTIKKAAKTPYEKKLEAVNCTPLVIADAKGNYQEANYYKVKEILDYNHQHNIYVKRHFVLDSLVRYLKQNQMLPAICFIFSRKHVEQAAKECSFSLFDEDSGIPARIEQECRHILMQKLPNYQEYLALPEYQAIVQLLEKGIAIHHAGIMPVLREMIELLFEKGYIKLLFATETFAVGINMPTKTVIFAGLTKYNGSTMRLLYPHEYTQMAGRAGRRGIDTIGHVFHCNNLFDNPVSVDYKNMLTGPPQKLTSKFKISFNLALNIIAGSRDRSLNGLAQFTQKSLLSTDIQNELAYYEKEHTQLVAILAAKKAQLACCKTPPSVLETYKATEAQLQATSNSARKKLRLALNSLEAEYKFILTELKYLEACTDATAQIKLNSTRQENNASYMLDIIGCVEHILQTNGFLSATAEISAKGLMAAQIQEIHPLVLAATYEETNGFAEFTALDLAALFACFNNVHVSDDVKSHAPATANARVNAVSTYMQQQLDYYYALETKQQLDTGSSYEINFDLQPAILQWCLCTDEIMCKAVIEDLKRQKNIFLGEFIKAILKINNICAEIEKICEMNGNLCLLEKIKQIPAYTLKYVVTNQSLYV
jgi:superfamily II RNA helicase